MGFICGALGLLALLKIAHVFRRMHYAGYGHGCGGHGRHGWYARRGTPPGSRWKWPLYSLFERLDATPGQEKVIMGALEDLRGHARKAREQWSKTRPDIAEAFRGEHLTEEQTTQLLSPYASLFDELRAAVGEALRKIHDALDERQRGILADLLASGWGWHRGSC